VTTAAEFQTKVAKFIVNLARLDAIVNGDADTTVETDGGFVPTFAKLLAFIDAVDTEHLEALSQSMTSLPLLGGDAVFILNADGTSLMDIYSDEIDHPDINTIRSNSLLGVTAGMIVKPMLGPPDDVYFCTSAGKCFGEIIAGEFAGSTSSGSTGVSSALLDRLESLERRLNVLTAELPGDGVGYPAQICHGLQVGESRSIGAVNNEIITLIALAYAVMFDAGGVVAGGGGAAPAANGNFSAFEDLFEELHSTSGETGVAAQIEVAYALWGDPLVTNTKFLGSTAGYSGHTIGELFQTAELARLYQHIDYAPLLAAADSKTYTLSWINLVIGVNDYIDNTSPGVFKAWVRLYYDTIVARARIATGDADLAPLMMMSVLSHHMRYSKTTPYLALAILELAEENERFIATCPTYICNFIDKTHETAESTRIRDAYTGLASHWWHILGKKFQPTKPIEHWLDDAGAAYVRFRLPYPPLTLPTGWVTNPGAYGFVARDSVGTILAIDTVEILELATGFPSPDTLKITPVSGTIASLEYAWVNASDATTADRLTGPRGCIADSCTETVYAGPSAGTFTLQNYCMPFFIEF